MGARLGADRPKAFATVGGRAILVHALESVFGMREPAQVVVVAPETHVDEAQRLALGVAGAASAYLTVVAGGATRQQSVAAGLAVVAPEIETVLVHDSARAFAPAHLLDRVADMVRHD